MTTDQKIKYFVSECQRFIDFFGLYEWQIYFDQHEDDTARAMCSTIGITDNESGNGLTTCLSYSMAWIIEAKKDEISICAFHEVMELMLSQLRDFAVNSEFIITQREIDDEVHRVIRRFENKIYPLI